MCSIIIKNHNANLYVHKILVRDIFMRKPSLRGWPLIVCWRILTDGHCIDIGTYRISLFMHACMQTIDVNARLESFVLDWSVSPDMITPSVSMETIPRQCECLLRGD